MLVNTLVFLLFIFESNISKVNILGLLELEDLGTTKFLVTLLLVNIYVFIRYYWYLMKHNFSLNYVLLFKHVIQWINKKRIKWKITILNAESNQLEKIDIDQNNNIIYYFSIDEKIIPSSSHTFCEILSNAEIKASLLNKKQLYLSHTSSEKYWIEIKLERFYIFPFIRFYIFDNNTSDYYLPILLWCISISLLIFQIISLSYFHI